MVVRGIEIGFEQEEDEDEVDPLDGGGALEGTEKDREIGDDRIGADDEGSENERGEGEREMVGWGSICRDPPGVPGVKLGGSRCEDEENDVTGVMGHDDVDAVLKVLVLAIGLANGVDDDDSIVNRPLVTVVVGGVPETDPEAMDGASEFSIEVDDDDDEEEEEDDDVEAVDPEVDPFSGSTPC